ncbi:serine O-acetyltransferase EpsC [Halobacteriovorax sp. XZX-3]|uniref:serine O-acetyltransferase EpsC n=1 Tax=unclassified Halobacteriovorax TaxID=2639665 RepID=UPI000CD08980|nr:serine O-acetyltransferase EpsC [Halobacteriovorax sp. DA5]POB14035.1 serine acetyltransferase [Halobacteriovorax sp. DA5]
MEKSNLSNIKKLYEHKKKVCHDTEIKPEVIEDFVEEALNIILPGSVRMQFLNYEDFELYFNRHIINTDQIFNHLKLDAHVREKLIASYSEELVTLAKKIEIDAIALLEGDPAAQNICEVVLCYPGLFAIASHRLAHFFYEKSLTIFPRMIAEYAHNKTGIDIHPGAQIGDSFFIDHGTGVVIGETAVIGNRVKIYQGVTLGALSVSKDLQNTKRHPTIEDDCVIYAHATILGGTTVIGEGSTIGGNVWLTQSVKKKSIVYHKSEVHLDVKDRQFNIEELTYEI